MATSRAIARMTTFELDRRDPTRKVCLGWAPGRHADAATKQQDIKRFVGRLSQQLASPTYNLPTIESVRIHYDGPLTPQDVQGSFGAQINPFGASSVTPPPGASSVESTMAEPGKLQVNGLICGIGWHLEPIPWVWALQGNAMATPESGVAKPLSPDVFTATDSLTVIPAIADFGAWQERAFYHMVRAYNLVWQMGSRTNIVRDSLRYTAYMPSNAQDGSASNSMVESGYDVLQGNEYYADTLGSPFIFLTQDRIRVGGIGPLGGGPANSSSLRPYRGDLVPATYGGAGLRAYLRGNTDIRKLTVPYLMKPGIPIGLRADVSDTDEQAMMQAWFSATFQTGGTLPANFTDFPNINTGAGAAGNELQLDGTTVAAETTLAQRMYFKFGPFKICEVIKGFELTDDQVAALQDVDISQALAQECGVQMGA